MARVFATVEDYREYTGDESSTVAVRLLKSASRMVSYATRFAVYATNDNGMPTDSRVSEAFTDAVCAQAEWWEENQDETGSGAGDDVQSASIAGVSFTVAPGAAAGHTMCEPALTILAEAGLLRVGVRHA